MGRAPAKGPRNPSPAASRIQTATEPDDALARLVDDIRACRVCRDNPAGATLPHEPRPVLQVSRRAKVLVSGQAPGTRVHASGRPFTDPSGERLRDWLGVTPAEFYDADRIAVIPMGFCFPGHDAKGGDLPPRPECAPRWRSRLLAEMPEVELVLLVGQYAQMWHPGVRSTARATLSATVAAWRDVVAETTASGGPCLLPLPHPSWRNNAWLRANPWFSADLVPWLRANVRSLID